MRRTLALWLCLASMAVAAPAATVLGDAAPKRSPFFEKPIRIVAHRGGAALAPENTVDAFRAAAERWPDVILETDAQLTADGVPVLIHDPTVDRTTDGTGEVAHLSLAAVQALDAAFRFSTDGGATFPRRGGGIRVPTVEQALAALPGSRFEIEIKGGVEAVPAVVRAVQAARSDARVLLVSARPEVLNRVRELAPLAATNFDEGAARAVVGLARGGGTGPRPAGDLLTADSRQLAEAGVGASEIAALARLGIPVQAFTIDEPAEMHRLLDLGVASLVTNRPDQLAGLAVDVAAKAPRSAAPAATTVPGLGSLVILGDSIGDTQGTSAYPSRLAAMLERESPGLRVVRAARSGARARDLPGQVAALPGQLPGPVAVVITIAGNDLRADAPLALLGSDQTPRGAMSQAVGSALDALTRAGRFGAGVQARVFLATIYDSSDGQGGFRELGCPMQIGKVPTDPVFGRWNDDLRKAASARGATIVDLHAEFRGHGLTSSQSWYLRDCIHPNDAGHARIASAFAGAIDGTATARTEPSAVPKAKPEAPATAKAGPPPPSPATTAAASGIHEGTFEIRLKSGTSFKVRKYTDSGDAIEVKRSGLQVSIRKSEIASIQAVD